MYFYMLNEWEVGAHSWFSDPPQMDEQQVPLVLWPWTARHGDPEQLLISTADIKNVQSIVEDNL